MHICGKSSNFAGKIIGMRHLVTYIALLCAAVMAAQGLSAQMVEPVKWSGETVGDSVRLTAVIEAGWHMTLISLGEETVGEEYEGIYSVTLAEAVPVRFNACDDRMCTAPEIWEYKELRDEGIKESRNEGGSDRSLWIIFLLGMLGGFMSIFTPCVWPIIPMTVSFFLKKGGGKKDAILYGLSIVIIYVGLGLLITILFGASALNALSTNAIVNLFFFALLVVFALSFFGLFEITLPDSWSTALDSKARSTSGFVSILLMAFTLVIVSFSCTGPIIGTLLVEAAGQSLLAPATGMLGFAIALALPFALFAMFPEWMKQLPKSGEWMKSFKVTLAFVELALSLKFLSVADMAYGWGILPRWLFIALWIICFAGLGVYLIRKSWVGKSLAIVSFAFAAYLVPGLCGAPVKAIAAFAPPKPVEGREVFDDYEQGLLFAKQENKPVLLDFTGYGCVNCRKMEAYVLSADTVQKRLANYVLITLYVDDKQDKDADGESEGNENSRLQREVYGSNAQPYYIQLSPRGEIISEPYSFSVDVDEFLNWLKY